MGWFRSYLTGRKQRTLANGKLSNFREIVCGVPQGSILGPALFILFVNDMPELVQKAKISQYADDTVIYASGHSETDIAVNLNLDLGRLTKWCRENKLHVNCNKTKYLTFGPRGKTSACVGSNLEMDGSKLNRVTTYKYLGITLDQNLTYDSHLAILARNVRHKVYLLRTVRPHLTIYAALQIYKTMILPIIEYGSALYAAAANKHIVRLQTIQNSGLRAVFGLPRLTPTRILHSKAGIDKLELRR